MAKPIEVESDTQIGRDKTPGEEEKDTLPVTSPCWQMPIFESPVHSGLPIVALYPLPGQPQQEDASGRW